jgi:hypothetical protein
MIGKGQGKITRIEVVHHTSLNYNCSNANRIIVRWWEECPPNKSYFYNFEVVETKEQLSEVLLELSNLITGG